jgi:hypothetical protein
MVLVAKLLVTKNSIAWHIATENGFWSPSKKTWALDGEQVFWSLAIQFGNGACNMFLESFHQALNGEIEGDQNYNNKWPKIPVIAHLKRVSITKQLVIENFQSLYIWWSKMGFDHHMYGYWKFLVINYLVIEIVWWPKNISVALRFRVTKTTAFLV